MRISKRFHFYAAHRNQLLADKCRNLHGHVYRVEVVMAFKEPTQDSITMLFSKIEELVDPIFGSLDHATLLHADDPALEILETSGACDKVVRLPFSTSAENLAAYILIRCREAIPQTIEVKLRETESTEITMRTEDIGTWPTK